MNNAWTNFKTISEILTSLGRKPDHHANAAGGGIDIYSFASGGRSYALFHCNDDGEVFLTTKMPGKIHCIEFDIGTEKQTQAMCRLAIDFIKST